MNAAVQINMMRPKLAVVVPYEDAPEVTACRGVIAANVGQTMPDKSTKPKAQCKNALQLRAERITGAIEILASLPADELVEVLLPTFDKRRLNGDGNQTDRPGFYMAAVTSMIALLEPKSMNAVESKLAESLAAVGRGVKVRSKFLDRSPMYREIAELLHAMVHSKNIPEDQKPEKLCKTLENRWRPEMREGHQLDRFAIEAALRTSGGPSGTAHVIIAMGLSKKPHKELTRDIATYLKR